MLASLERAEGVAAGAQVQAVAGQAQLQAALQNQEDAAASAARHAELRPGVLEALLTLGRRLRSWSAIAEQRQDALHAAEQAVVPSRQIAHEAARALEGAQAATEQARAEERSSAEELAALAATTARAQQQWGEFAPDAAWWSDSARRELRALWLDPQLNAARNDVYVAAVALHKAFIADQAQKVRKSLHVAIDILSGNAPRDLAPEVARAAWQALFFVVPVVSTTFASYARLFSHLGQEALGWLLIDEAGQATPQNAVGAIWRSQHIVVVGDPLQLEPVITIPLQAQQAIRNAHHVSEKWLPATSSVQRLADQVAHWGTWVGQAEARLWVGAPLRVHRRCDEPMFGIVNAIAYENSMVNGATGRPPFSANGIPAPPSQWINITGPAENNSIPAEHEALRQRLTALALAGFDVGEIFVVTPFRDVASDLAALTTTFGPRLRVGTVHTAQGKEADIVFVVLGGNPARDGAKVWAATKPNLLNVAASRARRRLYVIGDRAQWSRHHYFDTLAATLPEHPATAE